jgi:hypothetical protein
MRNRVVFTCALVCLLLSTIALAPQTIHTYAQGQTTTCDSTLITLLYVAEHDYGFKSSMDVGQFEKGQFKPLFDAMMAMGANDTMMATPAAAMAATEGAMMAATQDAMMANLKPGVVQGENETCTKLRAEVESFLFTKFSDAMMKK